MQIKRKYNIIDTNLGIESKHSQRGGTFWGEV